MKITKLDAAERQMMAAVRMHFDNLDPIPAYTLANAARELAASLCKHRRLQQTAHWALVDHPTMSLNDVYKWASRHANFLKHANNDPDEVLDFDPRAVDDALYPACADLRALRGSQQQPIEAYVFDQWYLAIHDILGEHNKHDELRDIASLPLNSSLEASACSRRCALNRRTGSPFTRRAAPQGDP